MGNATPSKGRLLFALLVAVVILPGTGKAASDSEYTYQKITTLATPCTPAPGGGFFQFDFEPWSINNAGDLAFAADFTMRGDLQCGPGLPSDGEGAFLWRKGRLSQITRSGLPAPGGGMLAFGVVGYTAINNQGNVAFTFGLDPFFPPELEGFPKAGLYRYSHVTETLSAVVVPLVTPAPGFGVFQSTGQHASLNNNGEIVFPGVVPTSAGTSPHLGQGIFVADEHGHISEVVVPGDPAPGGGVFDYSVNPWINDGGDVAFSAHVKSDPCIPVSLLGPGCGESIYFKRANAPDIQSIAHQGDPAPGGGHYRFAWGAVLNNQDEIVFMGDLTSPPAPLYTATGIFLHSRSGTVPIARPGDPMPGGGNIKTVNPTAAPGNYSLNNRGDVTFIAALDTGASGLYVYSNGALRVVARTGMTIPEVGTIDNVTLFINGGTLNNSGQIFLFASLTDGSGALLVASPRP